jgi:FMN phosphatase YigB (HAD superfamily)
MQRGSTIEMESADTHPQLEYVNRMLADKSCSVLSLDIFDTVLWRRTPRPADVFGLLGAQLRRGGRAPEWITDATFRRMRITAEREARLGRGSLGTEVSLFDIWKEMPLPVFGGRTLEELVEAEVEIERALTVVDLDIANTIQLARKHDIPIILVSDTYFTEDQLLHLLDRPELGSLQDIRVFRSHQHGADKAHGLWEIVLNEIGQSPEQVVHIGDNETADHLVPSELGVRTVFYERLGEDFTTVLTRENESEDPFGDYGKFIDPEQGDFGLTSLRAKTLQAGPAKTSSAVSTAWRYGASVLGPVLTGFAEWVAFKAHEAGTPVLWCPMREGDLLSELVNNAARARGWNVVAKPIWLSRQVTSIGALDSADRDSVNEFIRKRYGLTVGQLLSLLHLSPGDVPWLAEQLDTVLDNDELSSRVSIALTESPHLTNRLTVTATAGRERLLKALRNAGALDSGEITLVDLGWGGTIQLQLAKVLRIANIGIEPAGLYLATDNRSTKLHRAGLRAEGYVGQAGHPHEVVGIIARSPEVLEQSVNALCGSLVDFDDDGAPVLGTAVGATSQNLERQAVQDGIVAFQKQWNRYVTNAGGEWPNLTGTAKHRLANIITASIKSPTAEEASVFGNWEHEDNFGSTLVTRVLPDDLASAVPYMSPNDLADLQMRDSFWPALLAASDTRLSAAAHALASGHIDPDVFETSGEPYATTLRYRCGDEWYDGAQRRVRINHNGLSFARLDIEDADIQEVSLAIPGRPAVVRVDWIEAKVITGGRHQVLQWSTPDDFSRLAYADCAWLGANMMEFYSPLAAVWLPLSQTGATVTSAQITLGFAVLPQSRSGLGHRLPVADRFTRVSAKLRDEYRARGTAGIAAGAAVRKLSGR